MDTWDEVRDNHKPVQQTVRVPLRADLLDRIATLEVQAAREADIDKRENRLPVAHEIARQIQQLEDELAESEIEFTFVGLGRKAYRALIVEHAPTDEQKAEAAREKTGAPSHNPETFPPALMAASCIKPEGASLDRMTEIWEDWPQGQISLLWAACLAANVGNADVRPKSAIASAILHGSEQS